jgi:hypothetical protein
MNEAQPMPVPQILLTGKKIEGVWESVLLVRGEFEKTVTGGELQDLIARALADYLTLTYPDSTRFQVSMQLSVPPPGVAKL